jgi:hypothetical protein
MSAGPYPLITQAVRLAMRPGLRRLRHERAVKRAWESAVRSDDGDDGIVPVHGQQEPETTTARRQEDHGEENRNRRD